VTAMKVFPPRSLVLLPSCPADVTIYLTVSKVTEWPRSCILGQSKLKADYFTIWRQCVCMSQNFSTKKIEEEPQSDAFSRLLIASRPSTSVSKLEEKTSLPEISRTLSWSQKPIFERKQSKIADQQPPKPQEVIGGRILWSFISTPMAGIEFGFLNFMPQPSTVVYRKRCWCVLLDHQLVIYGRPTEIVPKEVVDLKSCYFALVEDVVSE